MQNARTTTGQAVVQVAETLRAAVRVAVDGVVVAYDTATQTADVRPAVRDVVLDDDGEAVAVESPVIYGVPVAWPSGGGRSLTWGLAAGDLGTLVLRDVSHDEVDSGTALPVTPASTRRWSLSDAVFLPRNATPAEPLAQVRSDGAPVLGLGSGEALHVGTAAGAKALAVAEDVADRLARLEALFTLHVHPVAGATATVQVPPPYVGSLSPPTPGPTTTTADVATNRVVVDS